MQKHPSLFHVLDAIGVKDRSLEFKRTTGDWVYALCSILKLASNT